MNRDKTGILRAVLFVFVIVAALWLIKNTAWVIKLFIISILIVYALNPLLVHLKTRFRLPHGVAVALVFMGFLLVCVLAISLFIPVIYLEFVEIAAEITENYPLYVAKLQGSLRWLSAQLLHLELEGELRDYLMSLSPGLNQALEYLAEAAFAMVLGVVDLFFIFFVVFYLLYDFDHVRAQVVELFPSTNRHLARKIMSIVDTNVGSFIRGMLIRCTVVGIATGLALVIAGMPYALLLGIIAGAFNFILYIGPYIAIIPALLLSLTPDTPAPLLILGIYVVIQVLDGTLLAPFLLGRVVKLRPLTIIISILAGGRLGGLLGMIVAVPLAGMIKGILELLKQSPLYREPAVSLPDNTARVDATASHGDTGDTD